MPCQPPRELRPWLKICGLRQNDQAAAVAALGVQALGVIGVRQSPRWLAPEQRPALFAAMAAANPACLGVLVVADPTEGELDALAPGRGHQVLQLHGRESPERCSELKQRLGLTLWKALRIRSAADLERARAFEGVVDGLLLDAWVADQLGGTGQAIPIDLLATFRPGLPWWLAGGIAAERVAPIWQRIKPDGLDASSAVERAPGDKVLSRVADLVTAVEACRKLEIGPAQPQQVSVQEVPEQEVPAQEVGAQPVRSKATGSSL
jgi:phosphoribosylanthranilate isomerase